MAITPKRSRRIVVQPLAHMAISKRGEGLLMKKMGILEPLQSHPPPRVRSTHIS
jgi:hypothetical protein